jgi:transcriptional regulator with PAS, ATPase and Fis domain
MIDYSSYEININHEMQNANRTAWKAMVSGTPLDPGCLGITLDVLEGWKRSQQLGIDPNVRLVKKVLSYSELEKIRLENKLLIDVSRLVLENLLSFIYGSGFNVAVSNKNGILLEVFGDTSSVELAKEGKWSPGADWSEASIGNNGIGTALYLKKPILIIGYEHYSRCCHHWASAVAPVFDTEHNTIGSVALCGRYEKIHPHTLGMIVAAAHDIEMQLTLMDNMQKIEIASEYQNILVNAISDGVIGMDVQGIITFCNHKAIEILKININDLIGANINSLTGYKDAQILKDSIKGVVDKEIIFNARDSFIKCICNSKSIVNQDSFNGTVLMIKDYDCAVSSAKKLVDRKPQWNFNTMIGTNKQYVDMVDLARTAAKTDRNVLILGESGTGKDILAQSIHNESERNKAPYVAINCGAIPKDLIASELFGYTDGAFTGAKKGGSKGKFENANGGTIFLDEIGEMPLDQQIVLLRVLEESSFSRIGSSEKIPLDVRVIAATNKEIITEIRMGRFRQDLYYRLNVFTIHTIPLRERKDDLEMLANAYLQRVSSNFNIPFKKLGKNVLSVLLNYDWPGNVRELQNVLDRALAFSADGFITPDKIYLEIHSQISSAPQQTELFSIDFTQEYKINSLKIELAKNNWNITATCKSLNISRPTLYRWLKKYNLNDLSMKSILRR